jgi:hypothetical protein
VAEKKIPPQKRREIYGWVSKYRETAFPHTILYQITNSKKF